nr:hypothetical protein [uncultured Desulfobacter sp.]
MPIQVRIKSHYNLDEHAYVFASFVYAFLIVKFFDNEVVVDFINFTPKILYFSELKNSLTLQSTFCFLLFFFFLLFIIESWWGSRLEQKKLGSFRSYIIFLSHPFLLFLFEYLVFDPNQFNQNSIAIPNLCIMLRFFFMSSLILGNLVIVRSYFSFIEDIPPEWLKSNSTKEKLKFLIYFVKENNKDRIKTFFISITLTACIYVINVPPKYQILVVCLAYILLISAILTLFKHIKSNGEKFNDQSYGKFVNEIAEQHLPFILRDKKDYGFLLLSKKKIPQIITNYIVNNIRETDIYISDDNKIGCCFLTSPKDIEKFESRIKALAKKANKETNADINVEQLWENHYIVFVYRKYRDTSFYFNFYKEELFLTFQKAYSQLKI